MILKNLIELYSLEGRYIDAPYMSLNSNGKYLISGSLDITVRI